MSERMMIDLLSLKDKAERAKTAAMRGYATPHNDTQISRFRRAASPETILSLCSELSAARERIQKLEFYHMDGPWIDAMDELPPDRRYCMIICAAYFDGTHWRYQGEAAAWYQAGTALLESERQEK
jgi:hypothetical protein